jgi:hypothetical protein
VWGKSIDPDNAEQLPAQRNAMAILDRVSKLNGWDAPAEVSITSPAGGELMRVVEAFLGGTMAGGAGEIIEADVLDGIDEGPDQDELDRYDQRLLGLDPAPEAGDQDRDRGLTGLQGERGALPAGDGVLLDERVPPLADGPGHREAAGDPGE